LQGSIDLEGTLSFSLGGITDLDLLVTAEADLTVEIGIDAQFSASYTIQETLYQEGIPEFCSSDMFCVGPYVALGADLKLELDVEGKLLAGGTYGITSATADLCAIGCDSSANGWSPSCESMAN
jgi:hypothetical protein